MGLLLMFWLTCLCTAASCKCSALMWFPPKFTHWECQTRCFAPASNADMIAWAGVVAALAAHNLESVDITLLDDSSVTAVGLVHLAGVRNLDSMTLYILKDSLLLVGEDAQAFVCALRGIAEVKVCVKTQEHLDALNATTRLQVPAQWVVALA